MTETDKKTNPKKGNSSMRDFEQDPNELFGNDGWQSPDEETSKVKDEPSDSARVSNDHGDSLSEDDVHADPLDHSNPSSNENEAYEDGYGYSYPTQSSYSGRRKRKKSKNGTTSLLIAFCLVLFIFVGIGVSAIFDLGGTLGDSYQTTTGTTSGVNQSLSSGTSQTVQQKPLETAPGAIIVKPDTEQYVSIFREVANKTVKTVVEIYVKSPSGSGAGSGVIYDPNGYIVTNYHVTDEAATSITVVLYDGTEYEAKFIYGDELADIAVVKIEKTDCDYAVFGDSDQMSYGDLVLAIGNPQGLGLSVTNGIISRPGEAVTIGNSTMNLLRTSAAINGGNSGGGLFNLNGELVGIVNAKLAASSIDNIGYAIPSSMVVKCLNDLKDFGYITGRARLGIKVSNQRYQVSWAQALTIIQVVEVLENGSAAKSGLQVGDILLRYEGVDITSFEILSQQLTKYAVGDTIKLTVLRPTIEYNGNNWQQYINSAQEVEIEITFIEFNPNL